MNFQQNYYQDALQDITHNRLYEAKKKLELILKHSPYHQETNWALGLVEAAIGLPHAALKRWTLLKSPSSSKIKLIESKLSTYEQLYSQYNEALRFIKCDKYEDAIEIFEKLLEHQTQLPLPMEFYKGYYLLLFFMKRFSLLFTKFSEAPPYIRNAEDIKRIERKAIRVKQSRRKRVGGVMSGAAAVFLAISVYSQYDLKKTASGTHEQSLTSKTAASEVNSDASLEKIRVLEAEKKSLEARLSQNEEDLNRASELEKIILLSHTNLQDLVQKAAFEQYREGRANVLNKSFAEAAAPLQNSFELAPDSYFSDDNLYLLIKANQELKNDNQVKQLIDTFFEQKSRHFKQSPYYDDLLLEIAKVSLVEGNYIETIEELDNIINKYPNSWTAYEAKRMKQRVEEQ